MEGGSTTREIHPLIGPLVHHMDHEHTVHPEVRQNEARTRYVSN